MKTDLSGTQYFYDYLLQDYKTFLIIYSKAIPTETNFDKDNLLYKSKRVALKPDGPGQQGGQMAISSIIIK